MSFPVPESFTHALALTYEFPLLMPSPRDPASPSEPSSLQLASDFAATIQFPHGTIGETHGGGDNPAPPLSQKHTAVPTAPVMVGVIKRRNGPGEYPKYPPAPIGHGGQVTGDCGPQKVNMENTGTPVVGISGANGYPNAVGAEPGASGAQFRGVLIHPPHPNPHPSHFTTSSICPFMASIFPEVSPPISIFPVAGS